MPHRYGTVATAKCMTHRIRVSYFSFPNIFSVRIRAFGATLSLKNQTKLTKHEKYFCLALSVRLDEFRRRNEYELSLELNADAERTTIRRPHCFRKQITNMSTA